MDGKTWLLYYLIIVSYIIEAWRYEQEDTNEKAKDIKVITGRRNVRREANYHIKRHMLAENQLKQRRLSTQKTREARKSPNKPTGHLTPLEEDDIDNDEVVSIAVGPPPMRPKYEKAQQWKAQPKTVATNNTTNKVATNLVKEILLQISQEMLSKQIGEDLVFGQYVGARMRNLTAELKTKLQHEILELILKYHKLNIAADQKPSTPNPVIPLPEIKKLSSNQRVSTTNETDEVWTDDFSNLDKLVG